MYKFLLEITRPQLLLLIHELDLTCLTCNVSHVKFFAVKFLVLPLAAISGNLAISHILQKVDFYAYILLQTVMV